MKLHLDKFALSTIINNVSKRCQIRPDILEKDYYVTLLLKELSESKVHNYCYFKGGTALYKALKSIRRFSEDIDLTINVSDCETNSSKQKRLKDSVLNFTSLEFDKKLSDTKGSIQAQYKYDSLYEVDELDSLQRFGNVRVEGTNFGISEPVEVMEISAYLYELADEQEKNILAKTYEVIPFNINTITFERIFIDKLFAAEHYIREKKYFDLGKHLYDLTILLKNDRVKNFINNKNALYEMIILQRKEEKSRYGGISEDIALEQFEVFNCLNNDDVIRAIDYVHNVYVFDKEDILDITEIRDAINKIKIVLLRD